METIEESEKPLEKRSSWEKVITTTPVILTVMATLLAGLSSSEMTLSQYFRSIAAQNQSKVGDQWAFFQAKRIRGTTVEMEVSLLPVVVRPGKLEPATLLSASQRLTARLQLAAQGASEFLKNGQKDTPSDGLRQAAEAFQKRARENAALAEKNSRALADELKKEEVIGAFAYLGTDKVPPVKDETYEDQQLQEALEKIAARSPEREMAPVVLKVKEDSLEKALSVALGNVSRVDQAGDAVGKNLRNTETLVNRQGVLAAEVYQAFQELEGASLPSASGPVAPVAPSLAMKHVDEDVRKSADNLSNLYKAAANDFTARRYRQEARYNQRLAELYEVQVHRNSARSDIHRTRSKNFFFGMLAAQAGVAIASFSLAARKKSVLWALAAFAGFGALLFSGYVYLFM